MCSKTHTRPKKDALGFISCYLPVNLKVEQISALKGGGLRTPQLGFPSKPQKEGGKPSTLRPQTQENTSMSKLTKLGI